MRTKWVFWSWEKDIDAPRAWDPASTVVVVKKRSAMGESEASSEKLADRALVRFAERGGVVLVVYDPTGLRQRILANDQTFSDRFIPLLYIERQKDLERAPDPVGLDAPRTGYMVSPREAISFAHHRTHDLIVVRGSIGKAAWPMHPYWVESLRDQAGGAGAAFAFLGWGDWGPRTAEVANEDPHSKDGAVVRLGENGYNSHTGENVTGSSHPAGSDMREELYMQRLGADRTGRLLEGNEHLALPDGLEATAA